MKDLLRELVEVMGAECPAIDWKMPDKTYDPSYHGGDCSKHGRYYGHCCCCDSEMRAAYERNRKDFEWERTKKLNTIVDRAKAILNQQ